MSYTLALENTKYSTDSFFWEEYQEEQSELQIDQSVLEVAGKEYLRLLDDVVYSFDYPSTGQEDGLLSNIADFMITAIRTAARYVSDTVKWFTRKIKSIVNFRVKHKKYRDKKYQTLTSLLGGMKAEQRVAANAMFKEYTIEYTPSSDGYVTMCRDFAHIVASINENVATYVSRDIAIFGEEATSKATPAWVTGLYEDTRTREALLNLGIKFEELSFTHESPFKSLPNMSLEDLKYMSIDSVRTINTEYQQNVWRHLRSVISLKEKFEKFERELGDKQRELKRDLAKVDKKKLAQACKSVITSAMLAGKLTSFLTGVEEALDTRRGWLIDKAIKACTKQLAPTE